MEMPFLDRFERLLANEDTLLLECNVEELCTAASGEAKELSLSISQLSKMAAELRGKLRKMDEEFCSAAKPQTFDEAKKRAHSHEQRF